MSNDKNITNLKNAVFSKILEIENLLNEYYDGLDKSEDYRQINESYEKLKRCYYQLI